MDGYEEMTKSSSWQKLRIAQGALFDLAAALRVEGHESYRVMQARLELMLIENQIRAHYRQQAISKPT
jgi:hypothetical protein